ncbi:hypothetical protein HYDPIDRAFT_176544 [Hydnomerulius pinastri MD-312]|uniref:FAD/NAD(P)-binding domain-containing protein n=1 Tax=Hydnomerulius pinastri MD-312 TaxID=994086 RepID=A0A0C9WCU8_9AGAM|nr:hypothetical protein HYDPIDRAFT_176544 [Hydnomerulius pinastri MD-312]
MGIIAGWKPTPPPRRIEHPYARIAIIGAGLTGVSSAATAISHGFEVVIFEKADRTGGIWAHENKTSGLQLNSLLYRFHPAVLWKRAFPQRDEILGEIDKIWKEYHLEERTRLNTLVTKVRRVKRAAVGGETKGGDISCQSHVSGDDSALTAHVPSPSTWYINDEQDGPFDAIIVTVGTCGEPKWVKFKGMPTDTGRLDKLESAMKRREPKLPHGQHDPETYRGPVLHSSQLDHATPEILRGKTVVVIGSGASAVEAVETALARGASRCVVLAREDKLWNVLFDTAIAAQPFGREMPLSFLWERFLTLWQYHGVEDLVPATPIFGGTPVVNDEFLNHVRSGKCVYVRGDTLRLTQSGVLVNVRELIERGAPLGFGGGVRERDIRDIHAGIGDNRGFGSHTLKGKQQAQKMEQKREPRDEPRTEEIDADVVVLATGYERPSIDFLPDELFPEGYDRPNLYLQNFCTEDWSVLMTNSSYKNAIGTSMIDLSLDTRILLTLLLDSNTRPTVRDMKLWVDVIRYVKRGASGGALGFFTYMELTIWLLLFHIFRPDRLRWAGFILPGWGVHPDDERLMI